MPPVTPGGDGPARAPVLSPVRRPLVVGIAHQFSGFSNVRLWHVMDHNGHTLGRAMTGFTDSPGHRLGQGSFLLHGTSFQHLNGHNGHGLASFFGYFWFPILTDFAARRPFPANGSGAAALEMIHPAIIILKHPKRNEATPMKTESLWKLLALSTVPFIMVLGNSMLIPVLPDMQKAMAITKLQAGLSITLFSLPAGLAIPVMGFLADKYGRKPIIIPALLLYGLGGVISGLAALWWHSYPLLLAGRIVQGLGASGTGPIAMALVSDIFTSQERPKALGGLEAANGLGKVISPILGAAIALLIWYALFFVYAFLAVPAAVLIWLLIKEPPPEKGNQSVRAYLGKIKEIFQRKGKSLAGCYAAGSAVLLILFGLLSYLSDVLEKSYGLDGIVKGLALAVPVLAMSSTSFFGGRYLERQLGKIKYFMVLGLILVAGPLGAFALFPGDMVFFAGILSWASGQALSCPALTPW